MINRNLAQGFLLIAISLAFGLEAMRYGMGAVSRPGPGLFPLVVSSILFVLGAAITIRALLSEHIPLPFNIRNIALILASLIGFAEISEHLNMIAGIVFLVFCSSLAGTSYSVKRNLFISCGLIAVAFALQDLLGLQLPLY